MKVKDTTYSPHGIKRCCIQSLLEWWEKHREHEVGQGQAVKCRWCPNGMKLMSEGRWGWERGGKYPMPEKIAWAAIAMAVVAVVEVARRVIRRVKAEVDYFNNERPKE